MPPFIICHSHLLECNLHTVLIVSLYTFIMLKQWLRHNHSSIYIFSMTKKKKNRMKLRVVTELDLNLKSLGKFWMILLKFATEYIVWQSPLSTPTVRNVIRMIDWRIYGPKLWQKNTDFEAVEGQGLWNLGTTKER